MVLPGRDLGKINATGYTRGTQLGKYSSYFAAAGVLVGLVAIGASFALLPKNYRESTFFRFGQEIDTWAENRRQQISQDYFQRQQRQQDYFNVPSEGERGN